MFSLDDPVFAAAQRQAEAERRAEEAQFNSPKSARERAESRDEFADVSDGEAVSVAREAFADELTDPVVPAGSDLPHGLEVSEFLDGHTAQVQTATGEPAGIMDSSVPLTTGDGSDTPIDLSLTRDGDSFAPEAARVDVTLPVSSSDPAELDGTGIAFAPVAADASDAVERSDRLIYPSIDTDTDYIVKPTELGAEAFWQLRSVDSPDTLRLRYDLPAGAELVDRSAMGGAMAVAIVQDGQTIGAVKPVSAVDAAGRPVDVSTKVDGKDLVISVDLHSREVQLPVLVDAITESWTGTELVNCGAQSAGGTWNVTEQVGADTYRACSSGWLAIGSYNNTRLNQNGSGTNVSYYARGNTYISDITWGNLQIGQANGANAWMGLFNDNCWCWEAVQGINGNRSASNLSQTSAHANWNRAVMGLWYWAQAWGGQFVGAQWVAMFIKDGQPPDPPTITNTSPSTTLNGNDRYFPWSSTPPSMAVSGHDIGLGVRSVSVVKDNGTPIWGPYWFTKDRASSDSVNAATCTGTRANPCPIDAGTTLKPFKNLTEGDNVGTVITTDAGDLKGFGNRVHVMRDTSGPSIAVSGSLLDAEGATIGGGELGLSVAAADGLGASATPGSGVRSIRIRVNNTDAYSTGDAACPQSNCGRSTSWQFSPTAYTPDQAGRLDIQIIATDQQGNASARHAYIYLEIDPSDDTCDTNGVFADDAVDPPSVPCYIDVDQASDSDRAARLPPSNFNELANLIEAVPSPSSGAERLPLLEPGYDCYGHDVAHDPNSGYHSQPCGMELPDIIDNPEAEGNPSAGTSAVPRYIGVYHRATYEFAGSEPGDQYQVLVAFSNDLTNWFGRRVLAGPPTVGPKDPTERNNGASQPTLRAIPGGQGFILAFEQQVAEQPAVGINSRIKVSYYSDVANLRNGPPTRSVLLRRKLGAGGGIGSYNGNEGTPSVKFVDWNGSSDSRIGLGYHYFGKIYRGDGTRVLSDREANGTIRNFGKSLERPRKDRVVDDHLGYRRASGAVGGGVSDASGNFYRFYGAHGDRTEFAYNGETYRMYEAQTLIGDLTKFRIVLYSVDTRYARVLHPNLQSSGPSASLALANPSAHRITMPDGRQALYVSAFKPTANGAADSTGTGTLSYYKIIP